ncbi:HD domain-containing protein [Clostridium butyricum]|uniref:Metal dependent phosphohydrolase n=1 Tax=Clostridium butyricum E4 str. BoNT E BL5262 TaxID=632245 RepID=C4II93_CLOBU|nr:HD domain-containing protein [Clostridium butyricum]EDT73847.1 HD superfamily hydrolase [Clostridium butyricum 5521]EEP53266.1 metal dependent phosphohydrolase [Clostridium butyricum E4 str. BoNT E BL5262]NFL31892.1 HD domain-containing protein [Clostridium butyricum]NFS19421.1 HD domain-containing protein [Clostridium butyricum]
MKCDTSIIVKEMINYYAKDVKRINHFLKVYSFAKSIGELEALDKNTQYVLEVAAIMHDIGIKISEEKYNSSAGNYQELEGPQVARTMLEKLNEYEDVIERVCFLIGHHHTYGSIDNIDYQILVEADFLVNIFEDKINKSSISVIKDKYFKTAAGIEFLNKLYI